MSDSDAEGNSVYTSASLNRPQITPIGPRTRKSSQPGVISIPQVPPITHPPFEPHPAMNHKPVPSPNTTTFTKPLPVVPAVQPFLPPATTSSSLPPQEQEDFVNSGNSAAAEWPPASHVSPDPSPTQIKSLAAVEGSEEPSSPTYPPAYSHDFQPQTESQASPPALSTPSPARTTPVLDTLPKLTLPPAIVFDPVTLPWKGLPLEAALWTLDSKELQNIVSRAIRSSANESFLRLLTMENLDKVLPAELERLDLLKTTTQSRYRFLVHRRTMLFQALNSTSLGQQKENDGSVVSSLTAQLAETTADCDQQLQELLRINDQIAQINRLIDVHSSSALAIALRKLNASYSRRTRDLNKARERIFQLEAELEDAWKEAEKMAKELDDYENSIAADYCMAVIETAEIVSVARTPSQTPPPYLSPERRSSIPMPMTPTLLAIRNLSVSSTTPVVTLSPQPFSVSPVNTYVSLPPIPSGNDTNGDTASIKSAKSTRSVRSTRSAKSHTSSVHAAKKRSHRASQSSLHLSISGNIRHGRKPSDNGVLDDDLPPPMPEIPLQYASAVFSPGVKVPAKGSNQDLLYSGPANASSILSYVDRPSDIRGTRSGQSESLGGATRPQQQSGLLKRQASLDTLATTGKTGVAAVDAYKGKVMDDIYIGRVQSQYSRFASPPPSRGLYASEIPPFFLDLDDDDSDIQFTSRPSPFRRKNLSTFVPDYRPSHSLAGNRNHSETPPVPPPKDPSKNIPSMWMNVDAIRHAHPLPHTLSDASSSPLSGASPGDFIAVEQEQESLPTAGPSSNGKGRLKLKTIRKIKGLTKRYTVTLPPLFNGRPLLRRST